MGKKDFKIKSYSFSRVPEKPEVRRTTEVERTQELLKSLEMETPQELLRTPGIDRMQDTLPPLVTEKAQEKAPEKAPEKVWTSAIYETHSTHETHDAPETQDDRRMAQNYRINLKLRAEYREYLELEAWKARKSITEFINDLIEQHRQKNF